MTQSFHDYEDLADNTAQLFSELERQHPKKPAIDLRFNWKGDYTISRRNRRGSIVHPSG